jgi:hypothetical protein
MIIKYERQSFQRSNRSKKFDGTFCHLLARLGCLQSGEINLAPIIQHMVIQLVTI